MALAGKGAYILARFEYKVYRVAQYMYDVSYRLLLVHRTYIGLSIYKRVLCMYSYSPTDSYGVISFIHCPQGVLRYG